MRNRNRKKPSVTAITEGKRLNGTHLKEIAPFTKTILTFFSFFVKSDIEFLCNKGQIKDRNTFFQRSKKNKNPQKVSVFKGF